MKRMLLFFLLSLGSCVSSGALIDLSFHSQYRFAFIFAAVCGLLVSLMFATASNTVAKQINQKGDK